MLYRKEAEDSLGQVGAVLELRFVSASCAINSCTDGEAPAWLVSRPAPQSPLAGSEVQYVSKIEDCYLPYV